MKLGALLELLGFLLSAKFLNRHIISMHIRVWYLGIELVVLPNKMLDLSVYIRKIFKVKPFTRTALSWGLTVLVIVVVFL